ncbi:MAG TPA: NmrA family NAD(P)-binding protein [Myxococcales bacterium]|nr:NmrA family NAD(P)-binding protein [Myxococcales bacterium]
MALYVVAGVSGHVGSVVASELLDQKQKVRVIVRDAKKGERWSRRGAEVVEGSVGDAAFVASALKGADGLFVLLPPNYGATGDYYAVQRKVADSIAEGVRQARVPHVVMLSSVGADRADRNGPIKNLHYLEGKLREAGTKLTAIRAGSFQENAANVLGAVRAQGVFPSFGPADYAYPQVATKDIGALAARELRNPPAKSQVIDLHGPAISPRQQAEKIGKALGKNVQVVEVPPSEHVKAYQQAGMSRSLSEAFAEMMAGFASGAITPKGDRAEAGKTTFDETLPALLG